MTENYLPAARGMNQSQLQGYQSAEEPLESDVEYIEEYEDEPFEEELEGEDEGEIFETEGYVVDDDAEINTPQMEYAEFTEMPDLDSRAVTPLSFISEKEEQAKLEEFRAEAPVFSEPGESDMFAGAGNADLFDSEGVYADQVEEWNPKDDWRDRASSTGGALLKGAGKAARVGGKAARVGGSALAGFVKGIAEDAKPGVAYMGKEVGRGGGRLARNLIKNVPREMDDTFGSRRGGFQSWGQGGDLFGPMMGSGKGQAGLFGPLGSSGSASLFGPMGGFGGGMASNNFGPIMGAGRGQAGLFGPLGSSGSASLFGPMGGFGGGMASNNFGPIMGSGRGQAGLFGPMGAGLFTASGPVPASHRRRPGYL